MTISIRYAYTLEGPEVIGMQMTLLQEDRYQGMTISSLHPGMALREFIGLFPTEARITSWHYNCHMLFSVLSRDLTPTYVPIDGDLKGYLSGRSTLTFHTPPSYGAEVGRREGKNNPIKEIKDFFGYIFVANFRVSPNAW